MHTLIISKIDELPKAVQILQDGGLVATPSETVYGLCANALDSYAVKNIFLAKGRPADNPLIIHIATIDMLYKLVNHVSPTAQKLIDKFWPGPLTLIFKSKDVVPDITRGGLDTVAIRFTANQTMQQLILESGLPLAAPSANTSGKPSPTNAARVLADLGGKIDAIIDGGECAIGLESTVIDTTKDIPIILRPGIITEDMIRDVVDNIQIDNSIIDQHSSPMSPGLKYTHYAPKTTVSIIKGQNSHIIKTILELIETDIRDNISVGVLLPEELLGNFTHVPSISLGSIDNLTQIANGLFENLRKLDDLKLEKAYTMYFVDTGVGYAIMNRLIKASGHRIILVD
ncbi:MAG: threonylcarbamoyl-AMP synthase [Epulopiscium sp. Nele67-Bin004]|nr:MAG: threonylcarbamoyl-AMP synthase [Epulopiscium sp. Nele67-Bin004]